VGKSAGEMEALREAQNPSYERRLEALRFRPQLYKLRVSEETWQDEQRLRINLVRCAAGTCCRAVPSLCSAAMYHACRRCTIPSLWRRMHRPLSLCWT
jgi:hypothetical protein